MFRPVHIVALGLVALLAGCAGNPAPQFSWYHPDGGEFLFSFDADQCRSSVLAGGSQLGADPAGPFFQCMRARGYQLLGDIAATASVAADGDTAALTPALR